MYQHIQKWTRPQYYVGKSWPEYYSSGVGQNRDSDALERANFQAMLAALREVEFKDGLPDGSATVQIVREGHWAVGWIEWIAIHESDVKALEEADRQMERLEYYPVLDEELWSRLEDEDCALVWDGMDQSERTKYLRENVSSRGFMGQFRNLREAIKGNWNQATNLLSSPSDILS